MPYEWNTVKPMNVLVLGELNVDLIFNDLSAKPKLGSKVLAKLMNLALASSSAIFAANIAGLGLICYAIMTKLI